MPIDFVTTGPWGAGTGTPHNAAQADTIIYELLQRIVALEGVPSEGVGIADFSVSGNQLTVIMTDATTRGPFTLPASTMLFRDAYVPATIFVAQTVFNNGDNQYLVLQNHVTDAVFDPGRQIGGLDVYRKTFGPPTVTPNDLHMFIAGGMVDAQLILYTEATRRWQLPINLTGSRFRSQVAATAITTITLRRNGISIGTIQWALGGSIPTVTFVSAVTFDVADSFSVHGPATADVTLADIAFDFLGTRI